MKIIERGGYWWVLGGTKFHGFPFPSRSTAEEIVAQAKEISVSWSDFNEEVF